MEKRTLLALALSLVIILTYPYLVRIFYPAYGLSPTETEVVGQARLDGGQATSRSEPQRSAPVVSAISEAGPPDETASVTTDFYRLGVSKKHASIVSTAFPVIGRSKLVPPALFLEAPNGAVGTAAVLISLDGKEEPPPVFDTEAAGTMVMAHLTSPGAYDLKKDITLGRSSYSMELRLQYENLTDTTQKVRLKIYAGSGLVVKNSIDSQYFEVNWIGEKEIAHLKPGKNKVKISEEPFVATSIKDRHFSSILKPLKADHAYVSAAEGLPDGKFCAYVMSPVIEVGPHQAWSDRFMIYLGPNDAERLRPFGLDQIVNFGKLDAICKLLIGSMQLVHGVTRNYGVAIIVLTVALNILLLPLTKASFDSMRRMQLVQPQMAKLKEKYGKDSARMNKEVMELYKRNKVNPMGGCLPMILQMPVFISLYVALSKSSELLGAKLLWINNLASPDNVRLPISIPFVGDTIHVLPLVMVGAMVAQQKISQAHTMIADPQMAQQQKIMTMIMPVFFGFMFYPMPSGLVIYWLTNTIVMVLFQSLFKRNAPAIS